MASRKRILIVGARGLGESEGGIEKFASEAVKRLAGDYDLTVLALNRSAADEARGVRMVYASRSRFLNTDKAFYYLKALLLCVFERFDCIIILGINFGALVAPIRAAFWKRPLVVTRSGSIDYMFSKWGRIAKAYFRLSERLLRHADHVISVSPSVRDHLKSRGISSILIRNGMEKHAAANVTRARSPARIVAIGRITPPKNYAVLIEAMSLLADMDVTLEIVGGADLSPEHSRIRTLIAEKRLTNVRLTGAVPRSEVLGMLRNATIFVNCSQHEGMSNAVLEAIQERAPVVLSDIEANRDLGLPEHIYFDAVSPAALAGRIRNCLIEPGRFVADPELFDDWDEVIGRLRALFTAPAPRFARAAPSSA